MICDFCSTEQAAIHLERHDPDGPKKLNICTTCADRRGLTPQNMKAETLNLLFDEAQEIAAEKTRMNNCPCCGTNEGNIKEHGVFGCSQCFSYFSELLKEKLFRRQLQGKHLGKSPVVIASRSKKENTPKDSMTLEEELQHAVASEDYELAATLRDRILSVREH